MELVTEPDMYSPSIDNNGNYMDRIPSFHIIKKGLVCPCGSRKDKIYESYSVFSTHIKTKKHQQWLESLNLNKQNFFAENEKLKETVHNQRLIIATLEKDIQNRNITIEVLTQELHKRQPIEHIDLTKSTVTDLLDFD